MTPAWFLEERDGLVLARCGPLGRVPGLAHGFATRCADGGLGFDAGGPSSSDGTAAVARRRLARAAGIEGRDPILLRQLHGAAVVDVSRGPGPVEGDAAVWSGPPGRIVPAVRTADCVPVLLAARGGGAAAAAHGGWRGIGAGILAATVREMGLRGATAGDLVAAVGPAIGPCCYEVGEEVVRSVLGALPSGAEGAVVRRRTAGARPTVDLKAAAACLLEAAGVRAGRIHVAPWCTRCRADLFHSFRRDGAAAGRMLAAIGSSGRP